MAETREPTGWKPVALDGGYGWIVVLGSFLIHVFADGFVYSFGVIAESLVKEFNGTNAEVSTILSLLTGLMLAVGPVAGAICNRIGCRLTTIIGAVIASIGCATSYYADSMTYLIGSVGIIMGTGFGLMYCPAIIIVTMYFEKYRSLATGVTVCGAGVGTAVFSVLVSYLIVTFGWRQVFLIYAGLVLLCIPCGLLYRPVEFAPIYDDDEEEKVEKKEKLEEVVKMSTIWTTITKILDLSLFADPVYVLFAVSNFLTSIGFNAPPMFMPMNAESVLGLSKESSAQTVSAYGIANIMGRIVFGLICDRQFPCKYGKDTARNRLWIYNWALMLCGVFSCFVFLMVDEYVFKAYCFFFGFLISSYVCLTSVVLVDMVGVDKLTSAFGLLLLVQGIATFVGPPIAGVLFDLTKRYDWTFAFCGICLFVSGIMLFVVPFIQKNKSKEVRLENGKDKQTKALLH
ncbi:hypothetical protein FO519_004825 [Halicephalobus sp. NKZ332]|nr:hypothetical protein FO519_004825 [Halicephalobus sp. NKZ332]